MNVVVVVVVVCGFDDWDGDVGGGVEDDCMED